MRATIFCGPRALILNEDSEGQPELLMYVVNRHYTALRRPPFTSPFHG